MTDLMTHLEVPRRSGEHVLIDVSAVSKQFGLGAGIRNVTFRLREGEVLGIVGPSGGGKTTLLRCIELLDLFESGRITYDSRFVIEHESKAGMGSYLSHYDSVDMTRREFSEHDAVRLRRQIGYVSQRLNLWENRKVIDNLVLAPCVVQREDRLSAVDRAIDLCRRFGISDKIDRWTGHLSGGERQRVALVRALMMKPKVLLLDEVTSALDPILTVDVMGAIKQLREEGMAMIVVTHHIHFATQVCDRVGYMSSGQLRQLGKPAELLNSPASDEILKFLQILGAAT